MTFPISCDSSFTKSVNKSVSPANLFETESASCAIVSSEVISFCRIFGFSSSIFDCTFRWYSSAICRLSKTVCLFRHHLCCWVSRGFVRLPRTQWNRMTCWEVQGLPLSNFDDRRHNLPVGYAWQNRILSSYRRWILFCFSCRFTAHSRYSKPSL